MIPVMKKLKSKSGISLAIALVFFLLCAMVGTVVLSAASVSAGNTARERQLYRETLAMTSAAQLLRQEFQGMTFQGSCKKIETVITTVSPEEGGTTTVVTTEAWEKGEDPTLTGGTLLTGDNLDLSDIYYGGLQHELKVAVSLAPVELDIAFQADADRNIPAVSGKITVGTDYSVTVVLSCEKNAMTISFTPRVNVSTEIGDPTVTTEGDTSERKTVTTYTTTVGWDAPTIREGGTV